MCRDLRDLATSAGVLPARSQDATITSWSTRAPAKPNAAEHLDVRPLRVGRSQMPINGELLFGLEASVGCNEPQAFQILRNLMCICVPPEEVLMVALPLSVVKHQRRCQM
jgi:hypothetical protein